MKFQWSYFKSWKMMLWKCCTQYASKFGKLSSGWRTGNGQFSFQSQRKAMPKNAQTTTQLHSSQSVQFSRSVVSDSLWPHGLQHTRPPRPSLSPRACSNSCPLSRGCHPTISPSVIPISRMQSFPSIRVFSNESAVHIRWLKYWSFSISPSNECSGLISFRTDWFDLLAVQRSLESSPAPQFESITSSVLSVLYGPGLTSVHDY